MFEVGTTVHDLQVQALDHTTSGGSVYTAMQTGLGRRVTVYVADAPADSEAGQRFLAQVTRLAAIEDRHLLPVYEVRTVEDRIVAIGGAGNSRLEDRLADGPLAPEHAVAIVEQMVAAVEALERAGVDGVLPTLRTVIPSAGGEARFSAVEALLDRDGAPAESAVQRLGRLLASASAGTRDAVTAAVPAPLRPVVERAAEPDGYASPRALADAARSALPVTRTARRRRVPVWIGAVAAAVGAVLAVVLLSSGEKTPKRAPANAPAARIAAVIDVGGDARSIGVGAGGVWVGRQDRQLVRVDPATDRVVGAPLRFAPPVEAGDTNVTVRAGAGAVFAMDATSRTVVRVDPKTVRVTARKNLGAFILGAAVGGQELWVITGPPTKLVRLDATTLRRIGTPIASGTESFDVEPDGRIAYLADTQGRFARIDMGTGHVDAFHPAGQTFKMALRGGTLWIPDSPNAALLQVDARSLEPRGEIVRGLSFATTATALGDSIWVTTLRAPDPAAPAQLHRIDAASGRQAGRPLALGSGVGWPQAGAGALWISSDHGVIKVLPTSPAPATTPNPAPPKDHGPLLGGPLRRGTYVGRLDRSRVSVTVDDDEWVTTVDPEAFEFGRRRNADTGATLFVPAHVFDRRGGVAPPRSVGQVLRTLRANPHLAVGPVRRTTIGGESAVGVSLDVRAGTPRSDLCGQRLCLPLFETAMASYNAERGLSQRLWLVRHRGRVVAAVLSALSNAELDTPERLLQTVRFLP